MLKAVFIGSRWPFDEILVHWLAQRTDLVGVVWTETSPWQKTWRSRLAFARRRSRRYGLLKVLDETLFYLHYHRFVKRRDGHDLDRHVMGPYYEQHGIPTWTGSSIFAASVNAPEVRDFLGQCRPDMAFAMCINEYFGKELRSAVRLGIFLWHEGITPEYKGLYSPFWAVHNLDFARVGYTLLRMDDSYDGGAVFVQGPAVAIDPLRHGPGYLGHKAIMDSLPAVEGFLKELEAGTATPIDRSGARPQYYTYPGLSDLIRQRRRLRQFARTRMVQA
jgi:hypothetical protein